MTHPAPAPPTLRLLAALAAGALGVGTLGACAAEPDPPPAPVVDDTVARVGEAALTESDLREALGVAGAVDSAVARDQIVEQWVSRELLVQAARAEGLDQDPAVRRLLEESERATLAAAALERLSAESPPEPSEADLRAAYERERDDLVLTEPYVRVRHLRTASPDAAEAALAALNEAPATADADSLFLETVRLYADDARGALALAAEYVPERRLADLAPSLPARVRRQAPGGPAVLVGGAESGFHVVQVVDRVRPGGVPPFDLVRGDLAERLVIDLRRRQEARYLQRLRTEARAAGRLDIR